MTELQESRVVIVVLLSALLMTNLRDGHTVWVVIWSTALLLFAISAIRHERERQP